MQSTSSETSKKLARVLDAEFERIARHEELPMEELVLEVARLVNRSVRQVYNYRSGRWSFEPALIPIFCRRFRSQSLLHALVAECNDVRVEVPETFDLTRMVSMTVRQDLEFYEQFLSAFESDGVQQDELPRLRELMERVVHNAHQFLEIAATDCERRQGRVDHRSIQRSSKDHSKDRAHHSTDHDEPSQTQTLRANRGV